MNTTDNILFKIFLLLVLALGWGSSAWAERIAPTIVSAITASNENNRTTWCYIHFVNSNGGYVYCAADGNNLAFSGSKRENNDNLWALIGTQSSFVLRNRNGLYAKWDGTKYVGTSDVNAATPCTYTENTNNNNTSYWNLHRISASAGTNWNPQTQIKEWGGNADGGSRMEFAVVTADDWNAITNPNYHVIQYSPAPTASGWAAGTHWYRITNDRSKKILAACDGYMDNNGYLKTRGSGTVAENSDLWCFVQNANGKLSIYNKAAGTNQVLGSMTNQSSNNVRTKLFNKNEEVANFSKLYTVGANSNGYFVLIDGLSNGYWDDNESSGYLATWQATQAATSQGGRFIVSEVIPEGYKLSIIGDNDYTVTYDNVEYRNGNILPLSIDDLNLNNLTGFSINCTDKFVYGPVIDKGEKTVTYTIREMVPSVDDLTTGFYQLQLFDDNNQKVNNVNTRINGSTGNINTRSNTIYVMPYKDVPTGGDQNLAKYSGVPTYANEASTFFYIEKNGSNIQVQSVNGHYAVNDNNKTKPVASRTSSPVSAGFDFPNGQLRLTGWVIQGTWSDRSCTGNEGPRVAYSGGTNYEQYNAAKVDLSQYAVYKVQIDNTTNASDISADPSVSVKDDSSAAAQNRGLSKVYQNGYFFFERGYVPTVEDFEVNGVNIIGMIMEIEGTDEIKTLHFKSAGEPWQVIITGDKRADEQITYRNNKSFKSPQPSKLASGEVSATVGDGEYFYFKENVTREELLDCDFSSYSPTRGAGRTSFVYGPILDMTAHTITCEIREAVTAVPETGWYQLKWDVSTDNNIAANTRHGNGSREDGYTNPVRQKNRFYLTMPKNGNAGRTEYMNYDVYPSDETTPLTFVKLVRSGNGVMMMTIDGRYMTETGTPNTNGSGFVNEVAYVGDGTLDFRHWFPFGTDASCFAGKATNSHNYFYTAPAKFADNRYEFYEVHIEANNVANNAHATYRGTTTNYSKNDVYRNGFFVFPKGHVPTVDDFTVTGASFSNMAIDIDPTAISNVKTLTFRQRQAMMGSAVNVVFKTTDEKEVSNATAYFSAPDGTRHELTAGQTYDLSDYEYIPSRFSVSDEFRLISVNYAEATQTLTFVLLEDMMSPALVEGNWAEGTKWYTIKNVRRNSLMGVTSSHSGYDDKIYFTDGAGDANSPVNWWCFVPDGDNGFVMYNKAFGPDFVLAVNSNYPQMTHKEEIAGKVYHYHLDDHQNPDAFTIYHNASHNGNAPAFNDVSHYLGTWNTSEANIKGTGNGSDFIITRVDNSLVEAAPLYTPYKIISVSVTGNDAPANAGANSTVAYKNGKYAGGSYSRKQGSYIVVRNDHALVSVTAPDARCNDLRVSTLALGASSITIGNSSTNPAYKTISIAGTYDVTTKYIVHRPNGLLWKAKKNKIDGTESYTVGTQTPDYVKVNMNGREVYLQNTNQVEVTHFIKPGDTNATNIWFSSTSSSSSNNGTNKNMGYARMFNYDNELDNSAIGRAHSDDCLISGSFITNNNTSVYMNGYVNKNIGTGYGSYFTAKFPSDYKGAGVNVAFEVSRLTDSSDANYADGDEPTGAASYICDFDGSGNAVEGFTDPNHYPGVVNMLEGTIAQRQIFHLLPASVIADKLYAYQGTEADAAFMEEETIIFPTKYKVWTKNASTVFHNVIPLGYNAVDYFGYTDDNKNDYFHLNYASADQENGIRMWAALESNDANISINEMNNGFTNCTGLFVENSSFNGCRQSARYITFCYPASGTIGTGNEEKTATIVVKLTNGNKTYNVKRFKLVFMPNTDPIPQDEIFGHDEHSRSDATLEVRFGKPYEEMKFKMPAQYNFTLPGSELHNMGNTIPAENGNSTESNQFEPQVTAYYQFPLDFSQMSYAYYGGTRWVQWGEYGLRHYNATANLVPVNYLRAKYQNIDLQSKKTAFETALNNQELTDAERANYQQLLDDATKAVAENQTMMTDEFYNGYFIYCDASEQPGEIAKLKINETLCPGTQFYVTAWMSNGTNYTDGSHNPNSVIFRIKGRRTDTHEYEQIVAYCPGQITKSVHLKDGTERSGNVTEQDPSGLNISVLPWQQVAFSFTNTAPSTMYDEFRLEVDNNSRGSSGADIFFDNVRLYVKRPTVEVRDAAPVCGTSLDLVRITTDFDAMMESIKGNSAIGSAESGTNTYYGVYAVLNKTKYDSMLSQIKNPTRADLAKAFMAAVVGKTNEAECLYDNDNNPSTPKVMDKSLYAFHTIKFYDRYETHQEITYNQLISSEEFEEAGRFMAGEVRSLVFNCKMEDENLRGGDKYMLVFSIQVDESHTHISGQSGQAYVTYFNLEDACRIIHEFSPSSATMVRIDGAQGVNPYKIDYCPGGAPNVTLNSYSYDITNGQLVQEIGVEYDWYYGTLEDYRKKVVHGEDGLDHTLNEALVNFRFFYPEITEANINTCEPKDPQAKDGIDYVLTQSMIDIIKAEVEAGTLKLRKTNALFELDKAEDENAAYTVVAIKLGKRVTQDEDAEGNKHYYVYCADPVELKFYTNHETPGAAIGLTEVSYSSHTPYNKRDKKGNLVSVPTRISSDQVSDLLSTSRKHYLNLPLSTMLPSGFYQVDKEDGGEQVAEPTSQIKFVIDPENTDVVVAETNDPQWKLYEVSGSEFYMPVVGKLTEINAHKMRKLLPWLKDNEESDVVGIDFTHSSIQRKFEPREGYYYVLRANFLETIDEYDGEDDPHGWKDIWKHKPSQKFDNKDLLKCKGTILIPLKIVPQYMKWTGRESTDWNNDRNWIRADKPELVPSEVQNYEGAYATYLVNTSEAKYNGLPVPTNDNVERSTDPDADPYEGLDIFVPMEQADNTTATEKSPYSFGYAPMQNTSVIIPSASEVPHAPLLKGHAIGEVAGDNIGVLQLGNDEKNTQIIEYDMVARLKTTSSILGSTRTYEAVPYYENTVKDITFQPGARMMGSEHLTYQKAWVEYALDVDRWYTLASPLQDTYAGEWYAPTGTDASTAAKQLTPYFHDINYTTAHYDRFRPAIFQRSWDAASDYTKMWLKTGGDCNSYIANDWSEVYNNVLKRYDTGGFSVKVEIDEMVQKPQDNVAIVRMPKADTKYTYYDINGQTAGKADDALPVLTNRYRLWTDKLAKSAESFQQTITNAEPGNNYFLVGNPFMTNLDMEAFFQANPQFEKTYWVLSYTDDQKVQSTSVRAAYDQRNADVAEDERWILTDGEGNFAADQAVVAPLQGFFVKTTAVTNTTTVNYTPAMQTLEDPTFKELYSPQLPVIDGGEGDDPNAAPDVLPAEGPMYTISGLRVKHTDSKVPLSRGIYIQSGKKQLK